MANSKFFSNIFDPWLVESADIGTADIKGQLCTDFTELLQRRGKKKSLIIKYKTKIRASNVEYTNQTSNII